MRVNASDMPRNFLSLLLSLSCGKVGPLASVLSSLGQIMLLQRRLTALLRRYRGHDNCQAVTFDISICSFASSRLDYSTLRMIKTFVVAGQ